MLNDEYFEVALNDEPMHRDITDRTIDPSAYGVLPIRKMFLESWIWTLRNRFVPSVFAPKKNEHTKATLMPNGGD